MTKAGNRRENRRRAAEEAEMARKLATEQAENTSGTGQAPPEPTRSAFAPWIPQASPLSQEQLMASAEAHRFWTACLKLGTSQVPTATNMSETLQSPSAPRPIAGPGASDPTGLPPMATQNIPIDQKSTTHYVFHANSSSSVMQQGQAPPAQIARPIATGPSTGNCDSWFSRPPVEINSALSALETRLHATKLQGPASQAQHSIEQVPPPDQAFGTPHRLAQVLTGDPFVGPHDTVNVPVFSPTTLFSENTIDYSSLDQLGNTFDFSVDFDLDQLLENDRNLDRNRKNEKKRKTYDQNVPVFSPTTLHPENTINQFSALEGVLNDPNRSGGVLAPGPAQQAQQQAMRVGDPFSGGVGVPVPQYVTSGPPAQEETEEDHIETRQDVAGTSSDPNADASLAAKALDAMNQAQPEFQLQESQLAQDPAPDDELVDVGQSGAIISASVLARRRAKRERKKKASLQSSLPGPEVSPAQHPTISDQLVDDPQSTMRASASIPSLGQEFQQANHPDPDDELVDVPQSGGGASASVPLRTNKEESASSSSPGPDAPQSDGMNLMNESPVSEIEGYDLGPGQSPGRVAQHPDPEDQLENTSQNVSIPPPGNVRPFVPAPAITFQRERIDLLQTGYSQPLAPDDQLQNVLQSSAGTRGHSQSPSTMSSTRQGVQPARSRSGLRTYQWLPRARSDDHERNETYGNLMMRGADALFDVSRNSLNWCLDGPPYYKAILPQVPVHLTSYAEWIMLETNFFALTVNQEEFYSYNLNWDPAWFGNKTLWREWKVKIWRKACQLLEAGWKSQAGYEPPPHGIAYDMGTNMILSKSIPEAVYATRQHEVRWQGIHTKSRTPRWDTTIRPIGFNIVDASPTQRCKLVPTSMTDLWTVGGIYAKWHELQAAVNSILCMHPAILTQWIEDRYKPRLYYMPGYPERRDPLAKYVHYPSPNTDEDSNMYVFRQGFHSTARLFPGGVYVNVWTAFAPFFRSQLSVDYVIDVILREKHLNPYDGRCLRKHELEVVSKALDHFRVETKLTRKAKEFLDPEIPTRNYRIWGLSKFPCRDLQVPIYTKGNILQRPRMQLLLPFCEKLFSDAFRQWPELDFKLVDERLKGLPAVKVHKTKEYYFPPWALYIKENDKYPVRKWGILSDSAYRMRENAFRQKGGGNYIDLVADYVKWRIASDVVLPAFKLQLNPTPLQVKGWFIPQPKGLLLFDYVSQTLLSPIVRPYGWFRTGPEITQLGPRRVRPIFGMLQCPNIRSYMVLYLSPTREAEAREWIARFLKTNSLWNASYGFGALHTRTPFIRCCGDQTITRNAFLLEFDNALEDYRLKTNDPQGLPEVVFLMMYSWRSDHQPYNAFKYRCDIELGIKSQVVQMKKWDMKNDNSVDSAMLCFLLKFNKRVGGKNLVLKGPFVGDEEIQGTMIFGADVTHPSIDVSHSIASIVATNDMPPRTYGARVRIQAPHLEFIVEIQSMVESLVRAYQNNNPDILLRRIFFFRDGVGDQQMKDVLSQEIPALMEALKKVGVQAKLVYLVCIKRHHTRFKDPVNDEIQPGCAVNDMPMFPLQSSFYLCTHLHPLPWRKRRASCRPTFYHVLVDQLGLSLPQLQTVIYHLSYVYERSNVTLGIIPASHYSHLACSRGRIHYKELCRNDPTIESTFPTKTMTQIGYIYPLDRLTDLTPHENLKDTMYYL